MNYNEISFKIDLAIKSIDERIEQLTNKLSHYSNILKEKNLDNSKRSRYELERNNYYILTTNDDIKKSQLFKKRCQYYKEYLFYKEKNDILNIKRNEYNFIKTLQDEVIFYFDSKERQLKQRAIIEKICDREQTSLLKIEELKKDRNKNYNIFLNREFYLDDEYIYTLNYLNYDVNEVMNITYKPKDKKKAS